MITHLSDINWPIYHIRTHDKLIEENKQTTIYAYGKKFIVDNKNLKGNTLGKRRVILKDTFLYDCEVYKLRKIFYTLYDVVHHKHKSHVYIDSSGIIFNYKKSKRRGLFYKKVIKTEVHGNKVYCHCRDIFKPIVIPFLPKHMPKYLGLLLIYKDWVLYELSDIEKATTWRLM